MRHAQFSATPSEVERLLHYMPTCAEKAQNEWARSFAADMAKRANWRKWRPSPKQVAVMRRMVADLFLHRGAEADFPLIED